MSHMLYSNGIISANVHFFLYIYAIHLKKFYFFPKDVDPASTEADIKKTVLGICVVKHEFADATEDLKISALCWKVWRCSLV